MSSHSSGYSLAIWRSSSKLRESAAISTRKQEGQVQRNSRTDIVKSFLSKTDLPLTQRGVAGMREPTRVLLADRTTFKGPGVGVTARPAELEDVNRQGSVKCSDEEGEGGLPESDV